MKSYLALNVLLPALSFLYVAPYETTPQLLCPSGYADYKFEGVNVAYEITCEV